MALRDYQQAAHDAIISHIRESLDPCLIEAATGAGKSHIIAAAAETLFSMSGGKHILCLAPNAELVEQNREKFLATGNPASIFSASAGSKCLRHPVVFGTPGTVKNSIRRFGSKFCAIIIDECHGLTPSIEFIIDSIREQNPNVRVIGCTATPYRLGEGFIFAIDENNKPVPDDSAVCPYFTKRVYTIRAKTLIERDFLTPPKLGDINVQEYDTSNLLPNVKNAAKDIDKAFVGHGRKTAAIVADIVAQSRDKMGVMLFASTVRHAEEILASLPPALSAIVTQKTSKADRKRIVKQFKARELKYLVNVGVFTTGFDAAHVDVLGLLRYSDSIGLLQQIIGRGLRLHDEKSYCLVLDYAGNIEAHCPDGDIFSPEVKAYKGAEASGYVPSLCADCGTVNEFSARPNKEDLGYDEEGYFTDLAGNRIMTDLGPMPGHYGRRCRGMHLVSGEFIQCSKRWTFKPCPECAHENDIAARYCKECKAEIIDPNEKLIGDFKRYKRDPTNIQTDPVLEFRTTVTMTQRGKECLRADYKTPLRSFSIWYFPDAIKGLKKVEYARLVEATDNLKCDPQTVTYKKDSTSGFYRVFGFNDPADSLD